MQNEVQPSIEVPHHQQRYTTHRAAVATIFRLLANPQRHVDLDGSGMVRHSVTQAAITGSEMSLSCRCTTPTWVTIIP